MLYNVAKRSGFLFNALAYQNKKRKAEQPLSIMGMNDDSIQTSDGEAKEIINFFKRCVVTREMNRVKEKLIETKQFRRETILNNFETYMDMWDFYFVAPELVG